MQNDRRDLLKKAAVGGAVAWTAPVVLSGAAAAGLRSPQQSCGLSGVSASYDCNPPELTVWFTIDPSCPQTAVVQVQFTDDTTCPVTSGVPIGADSFGSATAPVTVTLRDGCFGPALGAPVVVDVTNCTA